MNIVNENWFRVLNYWQKNEWRHSLTIPFLLGAFRQPIGAPFRSEEEARLSLGSLIDSIRNHRTEEYYVHIYRCPNLGQLVLTKVNGSPYLSVPIPPTSEGKPALYASDGVPASSNSPFEDLIAALWQECGEALMSGRFSCQSRTFVPFTEYDIKIIKKALA